MMAADEGPEDDADLLQRIAQRDPEGIARLYDRYGGIAFALASRILDDRKTVAEMYYCRGVRCLCEERLRACGTEIATAEGEDRDWRVAWLREDRATLTAEIARMTCRLQSAAHRLGMLDAALYDVAPTEFAQFPIPWAMPSRYVPQSRSFW